MAVDTGMTAVIGSKLSANLAGRLPIRALDTG